MAPDSSPKPKRRIWLRILLFVLLLPVVAIAAFAIRHYHSEIPLEQLKARYANENSRFAQIEGMPLHYRDEGRGPAVLLLHGSGGSLHTWEGWVQALQDSFRTVSVDLPGFGLTGPHPKDDYSTATTLAVLQKLLDQLQLDSFYVAGNSYGGLLAWEMALELPERVRGIMLIDAAGMPVDASRPAPMVFKLARSPLFSALATRITPSFLHRRSLLDVYAHDSLVTDELVQRYFELSLREGNRRAFIQRAAFRSGPNRNGEIPSIRCPVMIMWGEQDAWIPFQQARKFKKALPGAELQVYPDLGHTPQEEAPARTAADARRFLRQIAY